MTEASLMSLVRSALRWVKRVIEDWTFALRMKFGRKIMFDEQRQIVQTSATELIKGPCTEQELEAMQYVATHTTVSLPQVHRTYRRANGLYIAMDFVVGDRFDHLWGGLNKAERRSAVESIWEHLAELRACTPSPKLGVAVGSIEGGPVRDGILGQKSVGPFATIEEFHGTLNGNPNLVEHCGLWDISDPDRHVHSVLAHADIAPRNIIRRHSDGQFVIIDWECAGWWPNYWEFIKWHFSDFPLLSGWVDMLDEISYL